MEKEQKKLTHEELTRKFGELFSEYQRMSEYVQKLQAALNEDSFNRMSFFISMLFKVMEHPEMYNTDFVKWAQENIESSLKAFSSAMGELAEEEKQNPEKK